MFLLSFESVHFQYIRDIFKTKKDLRSYYKAKNMPITLHIHLRYLRKITIPHKNIFAILHKSIQWEGSSFLNVLLYKFCTFQYIKYSI